MAEYSCSLRHHVTQDKDMATSIATHHPEYTEDGVAIINHVHVSRDGLTQGDESESYNNIQHLIEPRANLSLGEGEI